MKTTVFLNGVLLSIGLLLVSCEPTNTGESITLYSKTKTSQSDLPQLDVLITSEQASAVALNYLNLRQHEPLWGTDHIKEIVRIENDDEQPILYVVNLKDDQGLAVISATTLEKPILAYA